ncbi:MAG: type-F conjugative transfer system secretin TraK [Nitrospiria bacterium]
MLLAIVFTLLSLTTEAFSQEIEIPAGEARLLPEVTTKVELSNTDVNRIICAGAITDIVYSKEKGLTVHYTKKDAFFKFEVIKENNRILYASVPTEIYITCGGNVYHMIALPMRIPSKTVRLSSGTLKTIQANRSYLRGLPFEEKVLKLIKAVYTDAVPDSFTVRNSRKAIPLFRDLSLMQIRTITVDGEGLLIKEFLITPKMTDTTLQLKEKDFLRSELAVRPVGITIDRPSLKPGESARMLIVERKGGPSHE